MESKKEESVSNPIKYKILGINAKGPKSHKKNVLIGNVVKNEEPHLAFFQHLELENHNIQAKLSLKEKYESFGKKRNNTTIIIDMEKFVGIHLNQIRLKEIIDSTRFPLPLFEKMVIVKVKSSWNPTETFICVAWQETDQKENVKPNLTVLLGFLNEVCNHRKKQLPLIIFGGFIIAMDEIKEIIKPPFEIQRFKSTTHIGSEKMLNFFITRNLDVEEVRAVDIKSMLSNRDDTGFDCDLTEVLTHDPITCVLPTANIKTNENAQAEAESATSKDQTETPPWAKELLKRIQNLETKFNQLKSRLDNLCEHLGCKTEVPATEEGS